MPTQNPEIPKKHRVYADFLSCDMNQKPSRNCSEKKLIQMSFLIWVDFCRWILLEAAKRVPKQTGTKTWSFQNSIGEGQKGTPKRGREEKRQKMSWQIGPLPLQPHFVRGPPARPLPLMSSEVQKKGKLVREVRGPRDKTNGRERDLLSWHFLSRPPPGVPFWPSPTQKACHFDTPFVLILLWVLLEKRLGRT